MAKRHFSFTARNTYVQCSERADQALADVVAQLALLAPVSCLLCMAFVVVCILQVAHCIFIIYVCCCEIAFQLICLLLRASGDTYMYVHTYPQSTRQDI